MAGEFYRSYSDFVPAILSPDCGLYMEPSVGCTIGGPGEYLLHSEMDGCPHCIAVKVVDDYGRMHCTVYDGPHECNMPLTELREKASAAVDQRSFVTFKTTKTIPGSVETPPIMKLLELQAGGRTRRLQLQSIPLVQPQLAQPFIHRAQ